MTTVKTCYNEVEGGAKIILLYPLLHVLQYESQWAFQGEFHFFCYIHYFVISHFGMRSDYEFQAIISGKLQSEDA